MASAPRIAYAAMVARFTGGLSANGRRGMTPGDINSSAG
jgi:hypothetical protein